MTWRPRPIPTVQMVPVTITTLFDVFEDEDRLHFVERQTLTDLGVKPGERRGRVFRTWVTKEELGWLRDPNETWYWGISTSQPKKTSEFIARVVEETPAHAWTYRDDGDYLVENGLTFRLGNWKRSEERVIDYVELDLLTSNGWTCLKSFRSGNDLDGARWQRHWYELARRHAETLVEIGATVSAVPRKQARRRQ